MTDLKRIIDGIGPEGLFSENIMFGTGYTYIYITLLFIGRYE